MRHLKASRKFGRTTAHRKALLRNLVTSLMLHGRIRTTEAKAKELRRFPRITEGDDAVAGVDKPKIAVDRILTIEDGGGGPGRVQGGGEFAADVAGFPDPDDEDLRPPLNRGLE